MRDKVIMVRCSSDEKAELLKAADRARTSVSALLRAAGFREVEAQRRRAREDMAAIEDRMCAEAGILADRTEV